MDGKGDGEEITYPHICFSVDNFEDGFEDVIVRDGESVGIELTASAPRHSRNIRTVSSKVVTDQMFGLAMLFGRTSIIQFGPNDKTFFFRTQNFFLCLHFSKWLP